MSFDRLAPHYHWVERAAFGGNLHRVRTALIPHVADARRALVVGEGDGRFLAAFLAANPAVTADVVDGSRRMADLARRRLDAVPGAAARARFTVADARTVAFEPGGYDLLVTHFFLDCFPAAQLGPLTARLAAAVAPGGRWLIGDFRLPATPGARRARAAVKLAVMYACFRLSTRLPAGRLVDPAPYVLDRGFVPVAEAAWQGGFLTATLWARVAGAGTSGVHELGHTCWQNSAPI